MSVPLLPVYSTSISGIPSSSTKICKRGRANEATVLGRRPSSAESGTSLWFRSSRFNRTGSSDKAMGFTCSLSS